MAVSEQEHTDDAQEPSRRTAVPEQEPADDAQEQSRRRTVSEQEQIEAAQDYFQKKVRGTEKNSILLVGCGEAGSRLAATFRLKPEFVAARSPELYPVRAIVMDSQTDLPNRMEERFGWKEPGVQISFIPTPPADYRKHLSAEAGGGAANLTGGYGGAGRFMLDGRIGAMFNFESGSQHEQVATQGLAQSMALSRERNAYMLTFSGLGGGTGSGAMPVIVDWLHEKMVLSNNQPVATFSVCIVPEEEPNAEFYHALKDFNLLASLYYMAKAPKLDGVMLADNIRLAEQGFTDYVWDVNPYLQKALMPVFLAAQTAYQPTGGAVQLDPADVRNALAPKRSGRHEFVVAGHASDRVEPEETWYGRLTEEVVSKVRRQPKKEPYRTKGPEELMDEALQRTTVAWSTGTGRSAIALLAGPQRALREAVPNETARLRLENRLGAICLDRQMGSIADFHTASFPMMEELCLTVLIAGCDMPDIESSLERQLGPDGYWARQPEDTLADTLRKLPEGLIIERAQQLTGVAL